MTCKRIVLIAFALLCLMSPSLQVSAKDDEEVLDSKVLIVYEDDAKEETLEQVRTLVQILTYQNQEVYFLPISEAKEDLLNYSRVICFQLTQYSSEFLELLEDYEKKALLEEENDGKEILFIGNDCIKEYYDLTSRKNAYYVEDKQVGRFNYYFEDSKYVEALAEEEFFFFLEDTADYRSGKIFVGQTEGYFCASSGVITHIPVTDLDNDLILAAISNELSKWNQSFEERQLYSQYFVINKVYPFEDPTKLLEIVNLMIEKQEAFVISVMPIYTNGDYPAIQRFCEVLRYAQANDGVIIMHTPINQMTDFDGDLMYDSITTALDIYISQGIYPMALQVPGNWMFSEETIDLMSHFQTIFVTDEVDSYVLISSEIKSNETYKAEHQWISEAIALDNYGVSYTSVAPLAMYFSTQDDIEEIETQIEIFKTSSIPSKSLWESDHEILTEEIALTYHKQILVYNWEVIDRTFVATEYDEEHQYNRNVISRVSRDLTSENQKLVVAVTIVSILFLGFILLARYYNRKKFLGDLNDNNED